MKPTFFERLGSYIIDIIIVSIILSLVCYKLPNNNELDNKEITTLTEKYINKEIDSQTYIKENSKLIYNSQKSSTITLIVNVAITIGYFVVFQYLNNGQTIGKKLFKLRVVNQTDEKPINILKGFLRSLFTLSIFSNGLNILFIYLLNENNYFTIYSIVSGLESIFILITMFLIIYKKDGRGLHDIMTNTKVIKEGA